MTPVKGSRTVAVISQLPPPVHGSTIMTKIFLETLGELGYSTTLIDRRFSTTIGEVGKPSIRKIAMTAGICVRLIVTLLQRRPNMCVLFATTRRGSLLVDWMLSEILSFFNVSCVVYLHTIGYRKLSEASALWNWIIRRFFSRVQVVVTLSPLLAFDIEALAPHLPRFAVANTVAEEVLHRSVRSSPERKNVVYVSNLIPDKGAADFIAVARKVLESHQDVDFSLIGAPTDAKFTDELNLLIDEFDLARNVVIVGPLYGEAKWKALESASVLVFPSRYEFEAQPLTIIEALHVGTPIVAYRAGAIEECVVSGHTGWVADPGDIEQLAAHVLSLLGDEKVWSEMSQMCQALYMKHFSRAAYERKWHQVLK